MEYVITKGSIKQGGQFKKPGDIITLDPVEAKRMDPEGICLKAKEAYDEEAKALAEKSRAVEEQRQKLAEAAKGKKEQSK